MKWKKSDFNSNQMEEIRLGLEQNLDISKYAKPELHWEDMLAIRFALKDNLENEKREQKDEQDI